MCRSMTKSHINRKLCKGCGANQPLSLFYATRRVCNRCYALKAKRRKETENGKYPDTVTELMERWPR